VLSLIFVACDTTTHPEFPHTKRVATRQLDSALPPLAASYASRCPTDSLPLASMQRVSKTSWAAVTPSGSQEKCSTCVGPGHHTSPSNHRAFLHSVFRRRDVLTHGGFRRRADKGPAAPSMSRHLSPGATPGPLISPLVTSPTSLHSPITSRTHLLRS
jgi:hypothetical protein